MIRDIQNIGPAAGQSDYVDLDKPVVFKKGKRKIETPDELRDMIGEVKKSMHAAADDLDFERAATLRDKLLELQALELELR